MRWTAGVIVFAAAAAICAIAQVAILISIIRRRSTVADSHVPTPRTASEIVWALVPAIALAFLLTVTWHRVRANAVSQPGQVVKVAE